MSLQPTIDRLRRAWKRGEDEEQEYQPLGTSEVLDDEQRSPSPSLPKNGYSHIEYSIFLLLGVSMLWAWNMFLAAGPYFEQRFRQNTWIATNFQSAEISVSTATSLGSMLLLTHLQANASYTRRIVISLLLNTTIFTLLAISTLVACSAEVYFAFLLVTIFSASLATAFCQNGVFAYVSGFAQPQYTQAIMTGQAVAGVLPCLAQIITVVSTRYAQDHSSHGQSRRDVGDSSPASSAVPWSAALAYFVTAAVISVFTLFAFTHLLSRPRRHSIDPSQQATASLASSTASLSDAVVEDDVADPQSKPVSLLYLLGKLRWLAGGVFLVFGVTMIFPVFTQLIISVHPVDDPSQPLPLILQAPVFIPLAFLFWNSGDLLGRLLTALPSLSITRRPRVVFGLAVSRFAWLGFYHLCNIRGRGAIVQSDSFYLVVVQLLFGLSSGYLSSTCMMGAAEWVEPHEREPAGALMVLCLVAGLTAGSLLSFTITGT